MVGTGVGLAVIGVGIGVGFGVGLSRVGSGLYRLGVSLRDGMRGLGAEVIDHDSTQRCAEHKEVMAELRKMREAQSASNRGMCEIPQNR
jgi:hypothetical protein